MICESINHAKTGLSKKGNCSYKFEYIKKEDLPNDLKKYANIKPKRLKLLSEVEIKKSIDMTS